MNDPATAIYLDIEARGHDVEVWLNDIPVQMLRADLTGGVSIPVHEYLVEGINTLEAVVGPGPSPSRARRGPPMRLSAGVTSGRVALTRYPMGARVPGPDGEQLAALDWTQREAESGLPHVLTTRVSIRGVAVPSSWRAAPRVTLNDGVMREATALVTALHAAFASGDAAAVIRLRAIALADLERVYPYYTHRVVTDRLERAMRELWSQPAWRCPPLVPDDFDFRVCGDGRLIQCVDRFWRPVVRAGFDDDGRQFPYSVFVASIDGVIRVVR